MKHLIFGLLLFVGIGFCFPTDVVSCNKTTPSSAVIIKPYYGGNDDAWTFDGRILKPYYGGNDHAWTYDGRTLKPYYGSSSSAWVSDSRVPIIIMAKVAGII